MSYLGRPDRRFRLLRKSGEERDAHESAAHFWAKIFAVTFAVGVVTVFSDHPLALVFPLAGLAAIGVAIAAQTQGRWGRAFAANSVALAALLATMAAGVYPDILPARQGQPFSLTIDNAAAGTHALDIAIVWFPLGMILAAGYFTYSYRLLFRSPRA